MYRERKRYKPMSSTLRRAVSVSGKITLLALLFVIYSVTISPLIIAKTEDVLISKSISEENSSGITLSVLNSRKTDTISDLYTLSLNNNNNNPTLTGKNSFVTTDPRVLALRQYLIDYNSPMYPYAGVFISEADKYGLDWRLLVAISGVESAFGRLIPPGSHNGWGWKGDPTRDWSHFTSWTHAIEVITAGLALGYGIELTPFQIEPTYCPPCGRTPSHPWANGVTRFMNEMDEYLLSVN
jgi:hypothetical protein